MTTITINAETIAKLEAAGFKRWTKGNMDRLYINCTAYGCEFSYYNTGNIRDCFWRGERVSNSEGRRFKATKVYVDLADGNLHVQTGTEFEDDIREAIEAIIAEAIEDNGAIDEAEGLRGHIISVIRERAETLIGAMDPAAAEKARANLEALVGRVEAASPSLLLANRELATANINQLVLTVSKW